MTAYTVDVRLEGGVLSGRAAAYAPVLVQRCVDEAAREGKNMVVAHLVTFIRKPTPFYWTQIQTQRVKVYTTRVWDQDVIYGPWLEGVGSRNKTTRFKGYAAFRKSTQRLAGEIDRVVAAPVREFVRDMS